MKFNELVGKGFADFRRIAFTEDDTMNRWPIFGGICSILLTLSLFAVVSCSKESEKASSGKELKKESASKPEANALQVAFAKELVRCSPPARSDDPQARDKASALLRDSLILKNAANEMIRWGGRPSEAESYKPDEYSLTEFSWMVYSSMYLSLFTFTGEYDIKEQDGYTILSAACEFRGDLDPGCYPYPFWHKPAKWTAYEVSRSLDFVFEKDKVIAAYRGVEPNAKPTRNHKWDGKWTWADANGNPQPHVALYDYILSQDNPHRAELDKAYRDFALEARKHDCMSCHAPDNPSGMGKLSLLNFPNQALSVRHEVVDELDHNSMPPKTKERASSGIQNEEQRKVLLGLAKTFAETGDKAIKFEEERAEVKGKSKR